METSLGKLQKQVDKLSKDNTRLRDQVDEYKAKNYQLRRRIQKKDEEFEIKIAKSVEHALDKFESNRINELTKENNRLKKVIFKLEQMIKNN